MSNRRHRLRKWVIGGGIVLGVLGDQVTYVGNENVLLFAGVMFEPILPRTLDAQPFASDVVAWRTAANRHFIVAALQEYWPSKARRR